MPIYEYHCTQCDNTFEEWSKSASSHEHTTCPSCGGDAKQLISNTAFILKGSGWYVTEYGNKKSEEQNKKNTSDKTEVSSDSSTNTSESSGDGSSSIETHKTPSVSESQKVSAEKSKTQQYSKSTAVTASSEVKSSNKSTSSK